MKSVVHVAYDIIAEEEWTHLRINEDLDPQLFQWTPPEGWEQRDMPDTNDALLTKGDKAPDFKLKDAEGGEIALAHHLGKPVWIMFWRVG